MSDKIKELEKKLKGRMSPAKRRSIVSLINDEYKRMDRAYRVQEDQLARAEQDFLGETAGDEYVKQTERREKIQDRRKRQRANRKERDKALRQLVKRASDIQKLNKSDISKVSSFASEAAKNFKAPETKDLMKEVVKETPATRGLLSAVAKGAGLIGAAATMNEFRKVHKEIKKKGSGSFGSKSLMEILK